MHAQPIGGGTVLPETGSPAEISPCDSTAIGAAPAPASAQAVPVMSPGEPSRPSAEAAATTTVATEPAAASGTANGE